MAEHWECAEAVSPGMLIYRQDKVSCLNYRLLFEKLLSIFRLERLDHLAAKFKLKCNIHEAWARGKEDMLQAQDFKKCRLSDLKVIHVYFMQQHNAVIQINYKWPAKVIGYYVK